MNNIFTVRYWVAIANRHAYLAVYPGIYVDYLYLDIIDLF
jgi:hypothetical protein